MGLICVALFFVLLLISTFFVNFKVSIKWPKWMQNIFDKIKGLFNKKEETKQLVNEGKAVKDVEFSEEIVNTITEDAKKEEKE